MDELKQIVFVVPGKDAPGFAKRTRRALALRDMKTDNPTPALIDALVEFLAGFVKADSKEQALELVWDASEIQWNEMLAALGGAAEVIPPEKSETLEKA